MSNTTEHPGLRHSPVGYPPHPDATDASVGIALRSLADAAQARLFPIDTGDGNANKIMRLIVLRHGLLPPHLRDDYLAGHLSRVFTFQALADDAGVEPLTACAALIYLHKKRFVRCEFTARGDGMHIWINSDMFGIDTQ